MSYCIHNFQGYFIKSIIFHHSKTMKRKEQNHISSYIFKADIELKVIVFLNNERYMFISLEQSHLNLYFEIDFISLTK